MAIALFKVSGVIRGDQDGEEEVTDLTDNACCEIGDDLWRIKSLHCSAMERAGNKKQCSECKAYLCWEMENG